MKTKTIYLYSFDELSETAKQTAIEKWYNSENYDFLEIDILESIETDIFKDIKLSYSLSHCQGDGISFSSNINISKFLERYDFQQFKKDAICEYFCNFETKTNNGNYSFCSKSDVIFDYNYYNKDCKNIESLFFDIVLPDLQSEYISICKNAEAYGYSLIEYRMSNGEFSELCEANDYTFLECGTMQNY